MKLFNSGALENEYLDTKLKYYLNLVFTILSIPILESIVDPFSVELVVEKFSSGSLSFLFCLCL